MNKAKALHVVAGFIPEYWDEFEPELEVRWADGLAAYAESEDADAEVVALATAFINP